MRKWAFSLMVVTGLGLVGCGEQGAPPAEQMKSSNGWFVELCFEKDGYKVYRFSDGITDWRYYVVPEGEMLDDHITTDDEGNQTHHYQNTTTVRGR